MTAGRTSHSIELNDLLRKAAIDPARVLVMRHRPMEKTLRDVLPWLAAERHDLYNAFQRQHGPRVETALQRATHLVSLIGHEAGRAIFVGLYRNAGSGMVSRQAFMSMPENRELVSLGTREPQRDNVLWFDLQPEDALSRFKGKLIFEWPGIERAWWRWAGRNTIPVAALYEESALVRKVPDWQSLVLRWDELSVLPQSWRAVLSQWRGIYYIFDNKSGKGYVGSAAGAENLLGRWLGYSRSGHGGNKLLRSCTPQDLEFSILQRVSPDMDLAEIISLENGWKERLHSRAPSGLNEN